MGGKYRITGDKYPRMRRGPRRGRIGLAVVAAAAAVGLVGWGSLQLIDVFTGGDKATAASPGTGCASASPTPSQSQAAKRHPAYPAPKKIKVNVLNATPRGGLAQKTADELKKRGFAIGTVGNATKQYDKKVEGPGLLLGAPSSLESVLPVLRTQLSGADLRADGRSGRDVDLVIGTGFKSLTPAAAADKALTALSHPAPPAKSPSRHC
ncbi:LytR C-terminal domain-containing protein [Streptomyces sp. NPDC058045]|uniref:LytR C-terminal domain-containing protein n=1 Tax=Streptomyces sp. NPDC058045 TaxID=3346311 RepID=UPI0036E95BBE